MKAQWDLTKQQSETDNADHSVKVLIGKIKTCLTLGNNGQVSSTLETIFFVDALFNKMIHNFNLDHDVLFREFQLSVQNAFRADGLAKPDEILRNFEEMCKSHLKNKTNFILITSISLNSNILPKRRRLNGNILNFSKNLPKKYLSSRQKLIETHFPNEKLSSENCYTFISISVKAANVQSAYIESMSAIDLYRSMWQLQLRKNMDFFASPDSKKFPSDSIFQLGMVHTLHLSNGKSAWGGLWQEEKPSKIAVQINDFDDADKKLGKLLNLFNKKQPEYRKFLYSIFQSYIKALDKPDHEFRFLKLWLTFELIMNKDDATSLIKMMSFFYRDSSIDKAVLQSLRKARNINVHVGEKQVNIELKNFQMCSYIEHVLRFFLYNPFKFKKHHELWDFISSTTDVSAIDNQIKRLRLVKKFIA